MGAKHMATMDVSPDFYENDYVSLGSECQCCSYLRSEVCYLLNELKSMREIITILKEEAKYDHTVNHDQKTYSESVRKPTMIHSQCNNYQKPENRLKMVHNQSAVKRGTTEAPMEKVKLGKQTSCGASTTRNLWQTTAQIHHLPNIMLDCQPENSQLMEIVKL